MSNNIILSEEKLNQIKNIENRIIINELKNKPLEKIIFFIYDSKARRSLRRYKENYTTNQAPHYKNQNKNAEKYYNSITYVNITEKYLTKSISQIIKNNNELAISFIYREIYC